MQANSFMRSSNAFFADSTSSDRAMIFDEYSASSLRSRSATRSLRATWVSALAAVCCLACLPVLGECAHHVELLSLVLGDRVLQRLDLLLELALARRQLAVIDVR